MPANKLLRLSNYCSMFKNKILLITGGTGSFGCAVLSRLVNTDIKEIRIFSRDEKKQYDMRLKIQNLKVKFFIGDVRDRGSVDAVMSGTDYVFHAAALKQVPSCEFFPMEAVKTNVLGTENVLDSAIAFGIKKVVVLSTDKACYPINAMGISKAMMEKLAIAKGRVLGDDAKTTICCTRFGNVMGSRGSVIPLFIEQIKAGGKLTITNPEMTRFMMTTEDAVDLVIYAWKHGHNGDCFVQKAPAVSIETLANALISLYKSNITIDIIGTRHGEKLFESLVTREEMVKIQDMGRFFRIPCDSSDLDYNKYFIEGEIEGGKLNNYNSHNTERLDLEGMKKLLMKLILVQEDYLTNNNSN